MCNKHYVCNVASCPFYRRRVLIVARGIGRFEIKRIVSDKPFVTAMVEEMADGAPATFQQAADISSAAMQVWQCMQQVKDLAGKLYSHAGPIGESHSVCSFRKRNLSSLGFGWLSARVRCHTQVAHVKNSAVLVTWLFMVA